MMWTMSWSTDDYGLELCNAMNRVMLSAIVSDDNLCGFMTNFASNCCYRISQSVTIALAPKNRQFAPRGSQNTENYPKWSSNDENDVIINLRILTYFAVDLNLHWGSRRLVSQSSRLLSHSNRLLSRYRTKDTKNEKFRSIPVQNIKN